MDPYLFIQNRAEQAKKKKKASPSQIWERMTTSASPGQGMKGALTHRILQK